MPTRPADTSPCKEVFASVSDFYLSLLDTLPAPVWRSGSNGRSHYFNRAWLELTGRTLSEEIEEGWRNSLHPDDAEQALQAYVDAFAARRSFVIEYRLRCHDGHYRQMQDHGRPLRSETGEFFGYVGVCLDISDQRRAEARIRELAYFDSLTHLPNRTLLEDRVGQALVHSERHPEVSQFALLCIDLDHFKNINDSLGHSAGDIILRDAAARMQTCVRRVDTVSRLGGDEFVALLHETGRDGAMEVARKLMQVLAYPYILLDKELTVTPSIGISLYPQDGSNFETLLQHAGTAMYQAKLGGRNDFRFFAHDMNTAALERLMLENSLRQAVNRGEFQLVYQPQISLSDGSMVGAEALLRWQHPELGQVSPGQFIPVAEASGLIVPIGNWVLREACAQLRRWRDQGLPPFTLGVNISASQFRQPHFARQVAAVLDEFGINPSQLELELTESIIMGDADSTISTLGQLKQLGVKLSIDDFGTGYSSLAYLKRFPMDRLKVDQSFIRDIAANADDWAIVNAIVSLGHSLRLEVVAEGVETNEQLDVLQKRRCDVAQGYHFSRPLTVEHFTRFIGQYLTRR